jgi:hypothetical protein
MEMRRNPDLTPIFKEENSGRYILNDIGNNRYTASVRSRSNYDMYTHGPSAGRHMFDVPEFNNSTVWNIDKMYQKPAIMEKVGDEFKVIEKGRIGTSESVFSNIGMASNTIKAPDLPKTVPTNTPIVTTTPSNEPVKTVTPTNKAAASIPEPPKVTAPPPVSTPIEAPIPEQNVINNTVKDTPIPKKVLSGEADTVAKDVITTVEKNAAGLSKTPKGIVSILTDEAKVAGKWLDKSGPMLKWGAIAAGAWVALAVIGNEVRSASKIFHPSGDEYSPPGYVRDVYGQIDSGSSQPIPPDPRILDRGMRMKLANTTGIVQRAHNNRQGHTRYGKARTDQQLQSVYGADENGIVTGMY